MAAKSGEEPCDGRKPKCGRCVGYDFTCLYAKTRSRRHEVNQEDASSSNAIDELRDGINAYDDLIRRLLRRKTEDSLDPKELHNQVKDRVKRALDRIALLTDPRAATIASPSDQDPSSQSPFSQNQHRYLGEVSDVHFFNLVKGFLQTKDSSNPEQGFDSYEQDGGVSTTNNESNGHTLLPAPVDTRELVEVYFSTIHIAYPFIPQSPFMANLAREGGIPNNATDLAILYVICAIGSYYTSFPGRDAVSQTRHECYFQRAMALTAATSGHHSIQQVTLLLVQCFYLLTVSKTDSCWTTLGQAVRIAQSIGLHVESPSPKSRSATVLEHRRRIWHSIYVLDRLLSLQLGRPPAIHDQDCNVALPSRRADNEIDWASDAMEPPEESPSAGDYFIAVIDFSQIVGCILRDVYGPVHSRPTPEMILGTQNLDGRLVEWKLGLPRKLRFDLGHSFDQNNTFRRQQLDDHSGFDSEGLRDDAETCLKIFEALSSNSKSARIARNMIQGLKQSGSEWRKQAGQGTDVVPFSQTLSQPDASMELQHTSATGVPVSQEMLSLQDQNVELSSDAIPTPQNWPAEITDSMAWSSQFLDTFQGDGSWI
ncbi:transcriptional activator acu-15 [Fusarium fujikuroi]|nr:transcriptional activator acu-15 [Fusarium fujikuroi]